MTEPDIDSVLSEAESHMDFSEFSFRSQVPIVGRAIAVARRAFNDIATRWYVGHYVTQQAKVNRALLQAITLAASQLSLAQKNSRASVAEVSQWSARQQTISESLAHVTQLVGEWRQTLEPRVSSLELVGDEIQIAVRTLTSRLEALEARVAQIERKLAALDQHLERNDMLHELDMRAIVLQSGSNG